MTRYTLTMLSATVEPARPNAGFCVTFLATPHTPSRPVKALLQSFYFSYVSVLATAHCRTYECRFAGDVSRTRFLERGAGSLRSTKERGATLNDSRLY